MRLHERFSHERAGNFGILTAIIIVPLLGCAGMAIDVGRALSARTELMDLADATALAAIAEGSDGNRAANTMSRDGAIAVAGKDGKAFFLSQRTGSTVEFAELPVDVSLSVAKKGAEVTSVVNFTAEVPTTMMRIFGYNSIGISGAATAVSGTHSRNFADFYMLLDNTPSMGIGATQADMDTLAAATTAQNHHPGCVFACHMGRTSKGKFYEASESTYKIARANNVTLRMDVVSKAATALVEKIKSDMTIGTDHYKVAVYTFGKYALEPGYRIERLAALTANMPTVSKALQGAELMTTSHNGYNKDALTSFDATLSLIGHEISGRGGSGDSAADRQKIVYFVTDGMQDARKLGGDCAGSWTEEGEKDRCLEPIDLEYCDALKARNIKIAVLYTTYIPVTGDHLWDTYINKQFAGKIASQLKACASSDLFFEVGPDDDMQAAMAELFDKSSSKITGLRLAN